MLHAAEQDRDGWVRKWGRPKATSSFPTPTRARLRFTWSDGRTRRVLQEIGENELARQRSLPESERVENVSGGQLTGRDRSG